MSKVQLICPEGSLQEPENLPVFKDNIPSIKIFDETVISFFDDLSRSILKNQEYNRIPALTALAFWLRKSNIISIKSENAYLFNAKNYVPSPLGRVFHVCPANVDTMFLYSLAISLLMGNKNVLRISQRVENPVTDFLFRQLNHLLKTEKYHLLNSYINMISYGHESDINEFLLMNCDGRIIWGGDKTINLFRSFPVPARSKEIAFADRISYALIKSEVLNDLDKGALHELARQFYNDSFTFDQKGCSSPQLIFLLGNEQDNLTAKEKFYNSLAVFADQYFTNDPYSISILKYNHLVGDAIDEHIKTYSANRNSLLFAEMTEKGHAVKSCGGGYFYFITAGDIESIISYTDKKTQTISYFGLTEQEIGEIITLSANRGVDRIVPVGRALEFSYLWDGYNLLEELTVKKVFI